MTEPHVPTAQRLKGLFDTWESRHGSPFRAYSFDCAGDGRIDADTYKATACGLFCAGLPALTDDDDCDEAFGAVHMVGPVLVRACAAGEDPDVTVTVDVAASVFPDGEWQVSAECRDECPVAGAEGGPGDDWTEALRECVDECCLGATLEHLGVYNGDDLYIDVVEALEHRPEAAWAAACVPWSVVGDTPLRDPVDGVSATVRRVLGDPSLAARLLAVCDSGGRCEGAVRCAAGLVANGLEGLLDTEAALASGVACEDAVPLGWWR